MRSLEPYQQIDLAEEVMEKGLTMPETRDKVRELFGKALKRRLVPLTFNNIIILICLLSSLFYFLYTFDITVKPVLGKVHLIGRYAIMMFLGAMFGSVTMTRMTYITGALDPVVRFFIILFGG